MTKALSWTDGRIKTLRLALNLAYRERASYLDAVQGDEAQEKRIRDQMRRLRKLQRDALGEETEYEREAEEVRNAPKVSIFDLARADRRRKGGGPVGDRRP